MIDLTLQMAETALKAAQAKAKALGSPMTVTVVDEAGRLVMCARGDGTGFLTTETSRAKAIAASAFRRSTAELTAMGAKGWGFWQVMPIVAQGAVLPTLGGAPIVMGGRVIGGIGCGGGTGEQDQECADVGAAAVKS
jgi:glc operon protein GlcG